MTDSVPTVVGRSDGGVSVRLSAREHELLRTLPDQLRPLLAGDDVAPSVAQRLFSRAYDDDELEAEYRDLIGDDTVAQRVAALDLFAETLDAGTQRRNRWSADLSGEETAAWLSAVNDARLVMGAVLGITDESDWEQEPPGDDAMRAVMHYLGWLEEALVGALTAALPDEDT